MLRFERVSMRYGGGPEILREIDLDLPAGSFHFLTGPSGAGKSTMLRLMYLAERPTRGRIDLFGQDTARLSRSDMPALRRRIGVVFQEFRLLDHLSTLDNVALPLRVARVPRDRAIAHATELLEWVGLAHCLDALPSTLSGGQQQRIAIARAVIGRPKLLIADEPTGNVDDEIAVRLLHLFEELNRLGTTILIATHNEGLLRRFRHPVLHIEDGRISHRRTEPGAELLG